MFINIQSKTFFLPHSHNGHIEKKNKIGNVAL